MRNPDVPIGLVQAVEINGLSKSYGKILAVDSVSLSIRRGEMFGLVGPDGAGKTTVIRILCGVISADRGEASVLGLEIHSRMDAIKKKIGYLSQKFSLYGDLTVDENIEFFAEIHQVAGFRSRREELLAFTRLLPFRDRLAERLSGGMRQKLALACTLVHTPEIIFLDEPTVGVDPVSRRDFWLILSDLLKQGMTVLMTTPYLDEAERCTRVALMNQGSIMVCDTPTKIRDKMKGDVLEVVTNNVRSATEMLRTIPGINEVQAFGDRLNVVVDDGKRMTAEIGQRLSQHGVAVESVRAITPSLENVFISVVRGS